MTYISQGAAESGLKKSPPVKKDNSFIRRDPQTAPDLVSYLWNEVQGNCYNHSHK